MGRLDPGGVWGRWCDGGRGAIGVGREHTVRVGGVGGDRPGFGWSCVSGKDCANPESALGLICPGHLRPSTGFTWIEVRDSSLRIQKIYSKRSETLSARLRAELQTRSELRSGRAVERSRPPANPSPRTRLRSGSDRTYLAGEQVGCGYTDSCCSSAPKQGEWIKALSSL